MPTTTLTVTGGAFTLDQPAQLAGYNAPEPAHVEGPDGVTLDLAGEASYVNGPPLPAGTYTATSDFTATLTLDDGQ